MKKICFIILSTILLIAIAIACKKEVQVIGVILNKSSINLSVEGKKTLVAIVLPCNATNKEIFWASDNPTVATVTNGLIAALSAGVAKITATALDGNQTATCNVEVYEHIEGEPEMILVEGGTFTMGCTNGECWGDGREEPVHPVTLSSYKIGKYPVTQQEWVAIMETNPSYLQDDNLPVEMVSWKDVQEFIDQLNEATGKQYRLVTEAEWEFVARGGKLSKGYKYSGSDNLDEVAWYNINSGGAANPVGIKAANELGIYDMSGNVWEWCNDWYGIYSEDAQTDPQGHARGSGRVIRGGSWINGAQHCRISTRFNTNPSLRSVNMGFRLALSL